MILHITARFRAGSAFAGQRQFIMTAPSGEPIGTVQSAALIEARTRIAKEFAVSPLLVFVDGIAVTFTNGDGDTPAMLPFDGERTHEQP